MPAGSGHDHRPHISCGWRLLHFRMNTLMDAGLTDGVALITGGSRGIGRAIVELLAAAGMNVTCTYREKAAEAAEVVASGQKGRIMAEKLDVRDAAACTDLVEKVVERHGRVDLLVNNAGVIRDNPLTILEEEDVRVVLETNVTGAFNVRRAVAPHMISKRRGKIINISSVAGEKGGRGQTNYAASKGAINAFTRALAVELAPRSITVNAVAPGVIETEMSQDVRELAGEQTAGKTLVRAVGKPEAAAIAARFPP